MARPFCADSWVAPTPYVARIGTMIHWRSPSPVLQTPSPPAGERDGVRGRGSWVGPTPFFARIGTMNLAGRTSNAEHRTSKSRPARHTVRRSVFDVQCSVFPVHGASLDAVFWRALEPSS